MKNSLGSFSKLFLVSLLAGSMMLVGCGESNPTSSTTNADDSAAQNATDSSASSYDVFGKVNPTIGQFDDNASIKITMTNIATKDETPVDCIGQMFAFNGVKAGYYKIEAVDSKNIYNPEVIYKKIDSNIEDLSLTMTPRTQEVDDTITVTLEGKIIDQYGNDIPFALITAVNTKTAQELNTSTNPDNGKYEFKNIPAGSYKVTFNKDSFKDEIKDLIITDENTILFDKKAVNNYELAPVTLNYKLAQTGALAGVLSDYNPGDKCLLYKTSNESATTLPGVVITFTADEKGYFFIKNLSPGWYCVAKDGKEPVASYDENHNLIGYGFKTGDAYFSSWVQVLYDTTSPVPGVNQ